MGNFVTTTNPEFPQQNENFTLSVTDEFTEGGGTFKNENEYEYTLTLAGIHMITNYTISNGGNTITFGTTTPINIDATGSISVSIEDNYSTIDLDASNNILNSENIEMNGVCYARGTEILCLVNKIETNVKIEDLQDDMLVKIYNPTKNEYKKIFGMCSSTLHPSKKNKLLNIYVLKKNKLGENNPFKDLYVTGGHSYLVDEIKDEETKQFMHNCNPTFGLEIHDKYKLLVSMSDDWEATGSTKPTDVFHFALECDKEFDQYGVYANGILSETMCLFFLKKQVRRYNKKLCLGNINIIKNNDSMDAT
jgi:hypothetical protein